MVQIDQLSVVPKAQGLKTAISQSTAPVDSSHIR